MDKRKITLTVIGVAVLLVVLVGSTYAYWTLNGTPKTSANVQVQTGGLILRLDDVDGITSNDVIDPNNLSFSKYFSITNESAADGYAKVLFKGLINTFQTDALVYELEEVQSNKSSYVTPKIVLSETVLPKSASSSNQTLVDGLLIEKGTVGQNNAITPNTKYYKLTVKYLYSETVDQSQDIGSTLLSGFTMEQGTQTSVTVTFNGGTGVTVDPASKTITFGSTYDTLPAPTKSGFNFGGWYLESTYTNEVTASSIVTKDTNHTLYAKWIEKKAIACIDASGNEITCPSTFTIGDRIAIGEGANTQYFRYLRTTSTSSNLSECGTTSSVSCADSTNGVHRFLAEYNLKRTGAADSGTAIASDALQDPSDASTNNGVQYGASNSDYNQSWVKTYLNNYATVLNTMIGETDAVTVNAMTYPEIKRLGWGCPASGGTCSSIPAWAKNSNYWLGSARDSAYVWRVYTSGNLHMGNYYNNDSFGVRAVVNISASLI